MRNRHVAPIHWNENPATWFNIEEYIHETLVRELHDPLREAGTAIADPRAVRYGSRDDRSMVFKGVTRDDRIFSGVLHIAIHGTRLVGSIEDFAVTGEAPTMPPVPQEVRAAVDALKRLQEERAASGVRKIDQYFIDDVSNTVERWEQGGIIDLQTLKSRFRNPPTSTPENVAKVLRRAAEAIHKLPGGK